jgi:predicted acyl esterase
LRAFGLRTGLIALAGAAALLSAPAGAAAKATATAAPVEAGAPRDYTKTTGLSQPVFEKTVRKTYRLDVPTVAGVDPRAAALYIQVTMPDPAVYGERRWPVILEASPYHGTLADREGRRIFPLPVNSDGIPLGLTGYFAPRGYAVVMVDLRGTGRSSGCLDHLGPNDASDLKRVVEWAATRDWSNGRVGMTGHSYVGSTPNVAAAQHPKGLVTIVPSAGLASMYDHQFQFGVPYNLQWIGPMFAYETLALQRHMPPGSPAPPVLGSGATGDNFGNDMDYAGCGLPNSAIFAGQGQATGQYQDWHAQRDWRAKVADTDIPVFIVHGVNDNAARIPAAEWFFDRRAPHKRDKVWLGQWDHGAGGATKCETAHPNCRFDQWRFALHAWFDRQLKQLNVDTGQPVEVFLNDGRVWTEKSWVKPPSRLMEYPDAAGAGGKLGGEPAGSGGSVSFSSAASGTSTSSGAVKFASQPLTRDVLLVGKPDLELHASLTGAQAFNLITKLESEHTTADGKKEIKPITYCAIQPGLRDGVDTPAPIVPGEEMTLKPQCFTTAHHLRSGDRLLMTVSASSPHHVSTWSNDLQATVYTGPGKTAFSLPFVDAPTTYDDFPLRVPESQPQLPPGPAQQGIAASVVVASAPGAGFRTAATSTFYEFDVTKDNASALQADAVFTAPGDYDLFLQRRNVDGTWSIDLASGTSSERDSEHLRKKFPPPGHYRLEINNWAGSPANQAGLKLTFFDRDGKPGPAPG